MKKLLSVLFFAFILLLSLAVLAEDDAPEMTIGDIVTGETTVGEVRAESLDMPAFMYSSDGSLCLVFELVSGPVRLTAQAGEEQLKLLEEIGEAPTDPDLLDEYFAKRDAVFDTMIVDSAQDLSGGMLGEEALEALAGRTVQELLDDGFVLESEGYLGEDFADVIFTLSLGDYEYEAYADADAETYDALYEEGRQYTLRVRSVVYAGISPYAAGSFELEGMPGIADLGGFDFFGALVSGVEGGDISEEDLSALVRALLDMLPEGTDLGDIEGLSPMELLKKIMELAPDAGDLMEG